MQRFSKVYPVLATVLLTAVLCSACRSTEDGPRFGEVFVYVALPLSGDRAEAGQSALGGARLAAKEINQRGGLLDHRVVVRGMDDRSDSDAAVAIAREIGRAI